MTFGVFSFKISEERIFWDDIPEPQASKIRNTVYITVFQGSKIPHPDFLLGIYAERWEGRDLTAREAVKLSSSLARLFLRVGYNSYTDWSHIPTARWVN